MGDIGKPLRETERPAPVRTPPPEPVPQREPLAPAKPAPVKAPAGRSPLHDARAPNA